MSFLAKDEGERFDRVAIIVDDEDSQRAPWVTAVRGRLPFAGRHPEDTTPCVDFPPCADRPIRSTMEKYSPRSTDKTGPRPISVVFGVGIGTFLSSCHFP